MMTCRDLNLMAIGHFHLYLYLFDRATKARPWDKKGKEGPGLICRVNNYIYWIIIINELDIMDIVIVCILIVELQPFFSYFGLLISRENYS